MRILIEYFHKKEGAHQHTFVNFQLVGLPCLRWGLGYLYYLISKFRISSHTVPLHPIYPTTHDMKPLITASPLELLAPGQKCPRIGGEGGILPVFHTGPYQYLGIFGVGGVGNHELPYLQSYCSDVRKTGRYRA